RWLLLNSGSPYIAPGAIKTFELLVTDDNVAEFYRKRVGLESGVYESGRPRVTDREEIYISDNDGLHFESPVLTIRT
ncbi:hypothetical protein GBAR_LOCUS19100, partial [Geodia barretti]